MDFEIADDTHLRRMCLERGLSSTGNGSVMRNRLRHSYQASGELAPGSPPRSEVSPSSSQPRGGYSPMALVPINTALPDKEDGDVPADQPSPQRKVEGIIVVGACNFDLISYVDRLPIIGETLHGNRFKMGCGGKGANQAVMAAKLGSRVTMVSKVGRDTFGQLTLRNFERVGVNAEFVGVTDEASSGVAPIFVDKNGNNSIVIVAGANDWVSPEDIEEIRPQISRSTILLTGLEVRPETALSALRTARLENVLTVFNPAPARGDLDRDFFRYTDIICPNETEAEILTGIPISEDPSMENLRAASLWMLQQGAGEVVITLGDKGAFWMSGHADPGMLIPCEGKVRAIDTAGAGDCFLGTFVHSISTGHSIEDSIRKSISVASISVTREGTQTSFPSVEEIGEW